jgi:pSer/pThr/pTyr-binding forkhead associated (FHA) protein
MAVHCPECGFANADGANYCQKCGSFLVTVSRDHALLVKRSGDYYLDDLGSLNGTYVNRHRIESHRLDDGDELQVGKFKLTYLHQ